MRRKRILALLSTAALICCLTGCQGDIKATAVDTEQVTEQSAALTKSADETEPKYRQEYDEDGNLYLINNKTDEIIPPFPEGWSGERISKMVTIDGYQLTLPCKVSDILDLSEDFQLDESKTYDYGDGTSFYQIWYRDNIVADGIYSNNDEVISSISVLGNEYAKFEGIDSNSPDEIIHMLDSFQKSESGLIYAHYYEFGTRYFVQYVGTNENNCSLSLSWEEIK